MARALCAWALNQKGKNSVRNLRYGLQTRLVRGMNIRRHILIFTRKTGLGNAFPN